MAVEGLTAQDIVTEKSFENAVMVHAAISGSTNTLLHLPAIAREFGVELDADSFDRMHRGAHYLLDIRPAGRWPAEYFYYAGGVPRIMEEIKSMLHLDVMTVTGKTLGENLEDCKKNGFSRPLRRAAAKTGLRRTDIIRTFEEPIGTNGTIAVLKGNLAPQRQRGQAQRRAQEMHASRSEGRPFDCEEEAIDAILHHRIQPGTRCSSGTRAPRAAACRRCSTPQRPSPRTQSSPPLSHSSPTGASPGQARDRPSAMCPPRPRRAGPSPWWKRAT